MAEDFRFQIRHGKPSQEGEEGIPEGSLKPYELGWAYNNGLYMGYTKDDNTVGIFRIVPYGINSFYKEISEKGYLPLTGGTITGGLTTQGNININSTKTGTWNQLFLINDKENSVNIFIADSDYSDSSFHNMAGLRYRFNDSGTYYNDYLIRYTPTSGNNGNMIFGEASISSTISGPLILTSRSYGTSLPTTDLTDGRIFFLKES